MNLDGSNNSRGGVPNTLSFGRRSNDSDDDSEFYHSGSDRDASQRSYEVPVVDRDGESSSSVFRNNRRNKNKGKKKQRQASIHRGGGGGGGGSRPSLNQGDHMQISFRSSEDTGSFGESSYFDGDESTDFFDLDTTGRSRDSNATNTNRSFRRKKDLAAQNLQAIESMARKEGPNHADEAFRVFPDHSYPNTHFTRKQLRKHMNAPSAYFHDLRKPKSLKMHSDKELGRLRLEVLQCFGLPTTSLVREVSAYAVAVMGSAAFQTDIIPNVANPMCELFGVL